MRKFLIVFLCITALGCKADRVSPEAMEEYINYLAARQEMLDTMASLNLLYYAGPNRSAPSLTETEIVNYIGKEIRFRDQCYRTFLSQAEEAELFVTKNPDFPEIRRHAYRVLRKDPTRRVAWILPDTFVVSGTAFRQYRQRSQLVVERIRHKHRLTLLCSGYEMGKPASDF